MKITVYKVEKTEWVTRAHKNFDRINSRKVVYWNALIDGKVEVDGQATRRDALRSATKIVARRNGE